MLKIKTIRKTNNDNITLHIKLTTQTFQQSRDELEPS